MQGLKSRAAFKLLEIDASYQLFKRGQVVVDLGYAPGSWSQVAVERTKPGGRIVGIDIIPAQPPRGVSTIQGNFLSPRVRGMVKRFVEEGERREKERREQERRVTKEDERESQGEGEREKREGVEERPSYIDLERMDAGESTSATATSEAPGEEATPAEGQSQQEKNLRLVDVRVIPNPIPFAFSQFTDKLTSSGRTQRHVSTLAPDPRVLRQQFE